MSSYTPDYKNKEHREAIRRNLSNCGSGVIDDACDMIDSLEQQLAAANARIEQLERYVDGNDLRSDYKTASHMRQALEHANARVEELEKENKGLLKLDVETLNIVRGRLDANIGGNAIVKIMAASLGDFLKDSKAENFCVIDIVDRRDPENPLPMEVTIKRASGKTPAVVMGELRDRIQQLESTIAACKAAGFVTESGEVRKVLGTLPITADGVIVGHKATIWPPPQYWIENEEGGTVVACIRDNATDNLYDPSEWEFDSCFSTREAAEAAKGGREG